MLKRYFLKLLPMRSIAGSNFYYTDDTLQPAVCKLFIGSVTGRYPKCVMAVVSNKPLRRPAHVTVTAGGHAIGSGFPLVAYFGPGAGGDISASGEMWIMKAARNALRTDFPNARTVYVRFVPIVE